MSVLLYGIFGVPAPLTYWTLESLRITVDACRGQHAFASFSTLKSLREAFAKCESESIVCFSDLPEADVAQAFLAAGAPYVICLETPAEVFGYCLRERAMTPVNALRFTSQCMASLHDLSLGPKARVLRRRSDLLVSRAVLDLCSAFGLTSEATMAVDVFCRLTGQSQLTDVLVESLLLNRFPNARPLGGYETELPEMGAPGWLVEIVNGYAPILEGREIVDVYWPGEAFLNPSAPDVSVAEEQDLTGPSRFIILGPYLHLPKGRWRATMGIELYGVYATALTADVAVNGEPRQAVRFPLPERGKFEFFLDFQVLEPRHFIEIRILLMKGAIEGRFRFSGAKLQRLPSPYANAEDKASDDS